MKPQDFSAERETAASQASAEFAFRILRGWHAGAQIVLQPGETLRIGGGEDCDIVLTDEVVAQATLLVRLIRVDDGRVTGWHLRRHASRASAPAMSADEGGDRQSDSHNDDNARRNDTATPFDEPVHIGPLTVTVSRADASWPAVFLPDAPTPAVRDDTQSTPQSLDDTPQMASDAIDDEAHDARQSAALDVDGRPSESEAPLGSAGQDAMAAEKTIPPSTPGADGHDASAAPSRDDKRARGPLFGWRRGFGRWQTDGNGLPMRWIMAVGVLAIVAALVALIRVLPGPAPTPPMPTTTLTVDSLTETRMALRAAGWIDGIRADVDSEGHVVVSGWVADDAARDRLSAALARLTPMPAMRIDIVADAVQAGRDAAARFGPFLSIDAGSVGTLRIRGVVLPPSDPDALLAMPTRTIETGAGAATSLPGAPTTDTPTAAPNATPNAVLPNGSEDDPLLPTLRAALHAALAAAVPNATLNDAALLTTDGAVRALAAALAQARLPRAAIHWERNTLVGVDTASRRADRSDASQRVGQLLLDAPAGTDIGQLQHTVEGFRNRYGDRIPIRTLIAGSRAMFAPAQLPFAIVSISSGPLPSVVVDGSVRLLPGGTYRGFRLVHVDDDAVVFDRVPGVVSGISSSPPASTRIVLQR
ncbi:hypothetical protein [Robbsia sp. KACC 23696]|uniref:hypothetical protein n=1 Tax=Robbsia sp. KACC 23696 TaxID=3149231 RepID=UPI00325B65AB